MPPPTPRTTLGLLTLGVLEQATVDLAQRDRERLLARARLDERADVLEQALAQLGVVVVDLAGTLGRVDHQRVLRADLLEQVVDRRVGDALELFGQGYMGGHSWCSESVGLPAASCSPVTKFRYCSAASRTSALTARWSNSPAAPSSRSASASRACTAASFSVPRPVSRPTSSSQDGGISITSPASRTPARPCRAPCSSISRIAGRPSARAFSTGSRGVP